MRQSRLRPSCQLSAAAAAGAGVALQEKRQLTLRAVHDVCSVGSSFWSDKYVAFYWVSQQEKRQKIIHQKIKSQLKLWPRVCL